MMMIKRAWAQFQSEHLRRSQIALYLSIKRFPSKSLTVKWDSKNHQKDSRLDGTNHHTLH